MDPIQLICDIGEINEVFTDARSIEAFLQKIVYMVARHLDAAVCSIYLYEEAKKELVLKATCGLETESTDSIRLKYGEGLTGLALKELRPVYERVGKSHPKFKFIPGIAEEKFDAFLAVPIIRGISRIGVLVVQRESRREFKEKDIQTLRAVASQLANMLENARLLIYLKSGSIIDKKPRFRIPKVLKGKVASQGFAIGPIRIIDKDKNFETIEKRNFSRNYDINDFHKAIEITEHQLEDLQARVEEKLSDAASLIFTAQLLMLKDNEFVGTIGRKIEAGISPPRAILTVTRHYIDIFSHGTNSYIKEKVKDIEDLSIRLLGNLVTEITDLYKCKGHIIVAKELFPSDILRLSSEQALGVVIVTGGVTSHLSILARSLQIPMVIIDSQKLFSVQDETRALLDAETGNLYINPLPEIISKISNRNLAKIRINSKKGQLQKHTYTKDGQRIRLCTNINLLSDISLARKIYTDGIGLYRTEFPFLIRNDFPSEEEQYVVYRRLIEEMPGKEITFRTLDIGGDKVLSYFDWTKEQNPFLGMRSIRFSLSNKELFRQQIRAILRAGRGASIRIMFPFISSVEKLLEAKTTVNQCLKELQQMGIEHNADPKIGIMIEVPAVISIIDNLAKYADFFSIGTNDLIQYILAVDRTNEKVADLYVPHHPAVLRSIKLIADSAIRHNIGISVCGDMAHQKLYIPFLLGAGIHELSIDASFFSIVQSFINKLNLPDAQILTREALKAEKISEIAKIMA